MLPQMLAQPMMAGVYEFFSLVWMELVMFGVAFGGYLLFHGGIPLMQLPKRGKELKSVTSEGDSEVVSEPEFAAKELQRRVAAGDHLAAYKLWQRIKSLDLPQDVTTCFPLHAVASAMRGLGRSPGEIAAEFRSAAECNEALCDADAVAALLAELKQEGPAAAELLATLAAPGALGRRRASTASRRSSAPATAMPQAASLPTPARARSSGSLGGGGALGDAPAGGSRTSLKSAHALLSNAARRGRLDEAMLHLKGVVASLRGQTPEIAGAALRDPLAQVLSLAARQGRFAEVASELPTSEAVGVALNPAMLNELLLEAVRRRDALRCRQVQQLFARFGVRKDGQTWELLVRGLASDAAAVQGLFEELCADPNQMPLSEGLGLALLGACAANQDAKLAPKVFEALKPVGGGAPALAVFSGFLKVYVACGLHDLVCDVYESEMAPLEVRPDAPLGNLIMKSAAQVGRSAITQALFKKFDGAVGDVSRHMTMIKACRRDGDVQGAVDIFTQLRDSGAQLNPMVYNGLLDVCIQASDATRANELFEQMLREGVADVVSFNIILKMHLKRGDLETSRKLLEEMRQRGLQANSITFNELLNARVEAGDRRGAWELVVEMQEAGVPPNSVTGSIVLKMLTAKSSREEFDRAMDLVDRMEERMDEVLFSCVIEACIRVGKLDMLSKQMCRYARQGGLVALSAQTYGSMIKAYGQARNIERVWELWGEIEQRQVRLTAVTLGCMIDALVTNRCAEDAWNLVRRLLDDPLRASLVNNVIYCTLLKGFSITKQTEHLFAVYAEMAARGTAANAVTYNTLIDACARCGCMHRVPELVRDMERHNVVPDTITYSTLVKGHCLSGDVDSAFAVLAEMRAGGKYTPDEILYNSLLDGCAKEHRLDEAMELFEQMRSDGVPPSNFTLCTMVKLLGRARQLPRAFAIIDELCKGSHLKPNIQVYTCLLQACIHNRQMARALQLHDEIVEEGCEPDQKTYNVLVRGCLRAGSLLKSAEVVRCAYRLPGHSFRAPAQVCGVDVKVLEELMVRLNQGSRHDMEVAHALLADLKRERGVALQDNVYCQVVQRAAGEPAHRHSV